MRNPKAIYDAIVAAPGLEAAVARLDSAALAKLLGHLHREEDRLPWPALIVRGVAMVEAVARFEAEHKDRSGAVGEGNS